MEPEEGTAPETVPRRFTNVDQQRFAALSGDANPIHVDPIAARRVLFGAPVVHGVHTVSWMLNEVGRRRLVSVAVKDLQVRFSKPIFLGEPVTLSVDPRSERELAVKASVGGLVTTMLQLGLDPERPSEAAARSSFDGPIDSVGDPVELGPLDIGERSGTVRFAAEAAAFRNAFPDAAQLVGAHRLRGLAALSRLVGMECPGLHSIFASIQVEFTDEDDCEIDYHVESVDPRFNMINLAVEGAGLRGRVQAFLRPPPVRQPSAAAVAEIAADEAYAGHHVLVVGGSRGLGELTAKLVSSRGASVTITYHTGETEAASVVAEINAAGGSAAKVRYDASEPAALQLGGIGDVTHLYYFATPRIVARRDGLFDAATFNEYARIYVKGFYELVTELKGRSTDGLRAFFPSTVFIDDPPKEFGDYVAAKAAGEALCAHLTKNDPAVTALTARLPRMLTDQTASLVPVDVMPAIDVMLPVVERVQLAGRPA